MKNPGFQWFVAWRYLMARPRRLSGTILVFSAVFAWVQTAVLFTMGTQPLSDEYIAAGLPVPLWFPPVFGGLLAVGPVLVFASAVRAGWFFAPRPVGWVRAAAGALYLVGAALIAISLLPDGAPGLLRPGAVAQIAAPLVLLVANPRGIPRVVPALIALSGLAALAVLTFESTTVGEGEIMRNLPGLIDRPLPFTSPAVLLVAGGAAAAMLGALFGVLDRRGGLRLGWTLAALVPVVFAIDLWGGMASWSVAELTRPFTAVRYHNPIWLNITGAIAGVLLVLSLILLGIRYFFTFFTTVSIGGVMLGSMALVITLNVMSGFETDLRGKILGSNSHVLISRDDEVPFTEYREVMDKVRSVRGVAGITPYLTSEVVIAGSSNYFNVVIKGIDPRTIARVTNLERDLEDPGGIERLWPLDEDGEPIEPPPAGAAPPEPDQGPDGAPGADPSGAPVDDPAPDDLDVGDDQPIDLSGGATEGPAPEEVLDPAPDDLEVGDTGPVDFSGGLTESPPLAEGEDLEDPDAPDARGGPEGLEDLDDEEWDPPPAREIAPEVKALPGVLVGKELERQINLYLGQEVKVISPLGQNTLAGQTPYIKPYRVAGRFFTGMYEYDLKWIYVDLPTLQDFLDLPDVVTGIEMRVTDPENTEEVLSRLRGILGPGYKAQDWKELNRSLFSALKLEKIAMFLVLAIIILVASFSIVGNLIMVVVEKAREIAVLKTLGASDSGVTRIFIVQGFFIGLIGTVLGVTIGLVASYLLDHFGLPIPPDVYYIDRLPIHVDIGSVALVAAAGVVISVAATIYPARIAARLRPVQGLRYE